MACWLVKNIFFWLDNFGAWNLLDDLWQLRSLIANPACTGAKKTRLTTTRLVNDDNGRFCPPPPLSNRSAHSSCSTTRWAWLGPVRCKQWLDLVLQAIVHGTAVGPEAHTRWKSIGRCLRFSDPASASAPVAKPDFLPFGLYHH